MLNRFRALATRIFTPVAKVLLRLGVSPDAVTIVGTLGVAASALWFFPRGEFLAAIRGRAGWVIEAGERRTRPAGALSTQHVHDVVLHARRTA